MNSSEIPRVPPVYEYEGQPIEDRIIRLAQAGHWLDMEYLTDASTLAEMFRTDPKAREAVIFPDKIVEFFEEPQ